MPLGGCLEQFVHDDRRHNFGNPRIAVSANYMGSQSSSVSLVDVWVWVNLFHEFRRGHLRRASGRRPGQVALCHLRPPSALLLRLCCGPNVMTTGTFSYPTDENAHGVQTTPSAGALRLVASTGPVRCKMPPGHGGAAAFCHCGITSAWGYLKRREISLAPAILFYVASFAAVPFEAKAQGQSLCPERGPSSR